MLKKVENQNPKEQHFCFGKLTLRFKIILSATGRIWSWGHCAAQYFSVSVSGIGRGEIIQAVIHFGVPQSSHFPPFTSN